jgi:hypothetical protein
LARERRIEPKATANGSEKQVLVIFSDMQNSTPELSLDGSSGVTKFSQALTRGEVEVADLSNVTVYVLGVDAAGKSTGYWQELRDSRAMYFKSARANLKSYTVIRESRVPRRND